MFSCSLIHQSKIWVQKVIKILKVLNLKKGVYLKKKTKIVFMDLTIPRNLKMKRVKITLNNREALRRLSVILRSLARMNSPLFEDHAPFLKSLIRILNIQFYSMISLFEKVLFLYQTTRLMELLFNNLKEELTKSI